MGGRWGGWNERKRLGRNGWSMGRVEHSTEA